MHADLTRTVTLPLRVRDLRRDDLPFCTWSGTPAHLVAVARELDRRDAGETAYLAACPPADLPVGIGLVDFAESPPAGRIGQLAVLPALQSLGVGTLLITAAEARIRATGRVLAELDVEVDNPRALALYRRLGYVEYGREVLSWDQQRADGSMYRHETPCHRLRKALR